jgi:hypothetical protein
MCNIVNNRVWWDRHLEDVELELDVELDDPGDDGHEAGEGGQGVPQHQAWNQSQILRPV